VIRNVIFDWSGTLVDDLPAVWHASNHVFRQAGIEEMTLDQFRAEFELPFARFYARYVADVPIRDLERWFHARFQEVQHTVVELPHARAFLEFCRERDLRTFVLSAVHPPHWELQAAANGFAGMLEVPYLGVRDKREKIRELLGTHSLDPAATLFIGDMQHDIETAKQGGVHSVGVLTGYNSLAQLRAAGPDLIVEHLGELKGILERNDMRLLPVNGAVAAGTRTPVATVGALIFNDAGQVLMIRTAKWSNLWGIPGGKIDWRETSEAALRREVKEETNLDIDDIRFVLVQDCIGSPEFYRDAHFLLLNYTCRARGTQAVRLNAEAQEYRWVSPAEAMAMPLNMPTRVLLQTVVKL
jgi:phosphoglycolate phosphatase-like HAD superfamily hydrolase/ADP-ribose pyrophosphatase YjhB (NUDIX family)